MTKNLQFLVQKLTEVMLKKAKEETGYFTLGYDGQMHFQNWMDWFTFQKRYGRFHEN